MRFSHKASFFCVGCARSLNECSISRPWVCLSPALFLGRCCVFSHDSSLSSISYRWGRNHSWLSLFSCLGLYRDTLWDCFTIESQQLFPSFCLPLQHGQCFGHQDSLVRQGTAMHHGLPQVLELQNYLTSQPWWRMGQRWWIPTFLGFICHYSESNTWSPFWSDKISLFWCGAHGYCLWQLPFGKWFLLCPNTCRLCYPIQLDIWFKISQFQ